MHLWMDMTKYLCVWNSYYLPSFTYSLLIYLLSSKDWGGTKQHPCKQSIRCSAGTSKTHMCMETKSEEWGENMLIRKMDYICPPSQFQIVWGARLLWEDNFKAEMRCSVGGRATRRQLLPPYLGFHGKLVSRRSNSCGKRKVHLFRPRSMT